MIAIDENSAARLANGSSIPDIGLGTKFASTPAAAAKVQDDLENLQEYAPPAGRSTSESSPTSVILRTARVSTEQSD